MNDCQTFHSPGGWRSWWAQNLFVTGASATGDESIEAMPRLVLVGVQAIGKIRSTFFSCETIEITWNRWLDTLDPRLGSEVLVATKWNDWSWSLHRFWSRWTSLTWRWRKPSNFARQWKFWNRWLSSSAIMLKYLESSFPNRGTHSSRSWCKGTVPKGRRHEKATSIESHPSKVVRFLCILCVCGRSLMIRWTKLTRWSSAPCLHLIPGAYMIILMSERFWQHARDSSLHNCKQIMTCALSVSNEGTRLGFNLWRTCWRFRNAQPQRFQFKALIQNVPRGLRKLEESGPTSNHSGSSAEAWTFECWIVCWWAACLLRAYCRYDPKGLSRGGSDLVCTSVSLSVVFWRSLSQ